MPPTDADLILATGRGDSSAFEALYFRHRDWAASVAFRFCGDRDESLDVLQEAFLYVARKAAEYEPRATFRAFLYPVVKHLALKRRRREIPMEVPDRPAPAAGASLDEHVAALSEEHREVVLLRYADGLEIAEIAAALGIPEGTVKSRLHHAVRKLREALSP